MFRLIISACVVALSLCATIWLTYAQQTDVVFGDLELAQQNVSSAGLASGEFGIAQYSSPELQALLINNGPQDLEAGAGLAIPSLATGFITCQNLTGPVAPQILYQSPEINSFLVQAATQQVLTQISVPATATTVPNTLIELECRFNFTNEFSLTPGSVVVDSIKLRVIETSPGRFDATLNLARDPIKEKLDTAVPQRGAEWVQAFILGVLNDLAIPGIIIAGIFIALIGFYYMFFSDDADQVSTWFSYIIWGVVGVIVMMSALFIATTIYESILSSGEIQAVSGVEIAWQFYDLIVYPFLKLFLYIVVGVLFLTLMSRVFFFLSSSSEEVQTKSKNIIVASVTWILVILASNELIEFVYGSEQQIRNQNATDVTQVGSPLFANANIPILYEIVRWVMSLAAFFVLAIIIFLTFKFLIKPDSEENLASIRRYIMYVFIGVVVIGAGYLLTNFVLIT